MTTAATFSVAAKKLSEYLTQWFFNLPQSIALENAYNFVGVQQTASMKEIMRQYRKRAKKLHPDVKDGSAEEFLKLETAMELIKASHVEK